MRWCSAGTGNKVGAILGGALVAYIPLRFTAIAEYKFLIFGIALVLIMIFRPADCFPHGSGCLPTDAAPTTRCWDVAAAPDRRQMRRVARGSTPPVWAVLKRMG